MRIRGLPDKGGDKYVNDVFMSLNGAVFDDKAGSKIEVRATTQRYTSYLMLPVFITVIVSLGVALLSLGSILTGKVLFSSKMVMKIVGNHHEKKSEIDNLDKGKKTKRIQPSAGGSQGLQDNRLFDYKPGKPVENDEFLFVIDFSDGLTSYLRRILLLETKFYIMQLMSWCWLSECVSKSSGVLFNLKYT